MATTESPQKALFRVDASPAIGSGHLARCLTLARALARCGFEITIATHDPSESTRAWIDHEGHRTAVLDARDDTTEARSTRPDASLVVVDGYHFDATYHRALRAPGRIVCVIDDLADAPIGGDAVLNGNLYGEDLPYPPGLAAIVGPTYALVRDEFRVARQAKTSQGERRDEDRPPRLLVTMGGADPTGETGKVLSALSRIDVPLDVHVIVGGTNPSVDIVRASAKRLAQHRVDVKVNVATMGDEMLWADLAVTASGGTCLELSCVGVPALVIQVAANQRLVARALADRDLMTVLGESRAVDGSTIAKALAALVSARTTFAAIAERQRRTVDGGGADRAAARLSSLLRSRSRV